MKGEYDRESTAPAAGLAIGLTYDLRSSYLAQGYTEEETAEFDSPATIEAIGAALSELGHRPEHIGNAWELTGRLAAGERWDLVFNIAEGLYGPGREALIPALLDAYRIPYTFSDPCVMAVSLHKAMAKSIIRDLGLPTPAFALIREEADLQAERLKALELRYPLFAKPVAEGTGKGITSASKIEEPEALARRCRELLARYRQPVLVEEYLPGREFTVGILGTGGRASVLGTLEVIIRDQGEQGAYSYLNKENCDRLVDYRLARDEAARAAESVCLELWRALDCRDAGRVDVRLDADGRPGIMELNPLAGLHPTHSDLPMIARAAGMSYRELIARIVASARRRVQPYAREGLSPASVPSSSSILV